MGFAYMKTLHGLIALLQLAVGFGALFACSFVWTNGDVYFQFYFTHIPAQIYVMFALLITWFITIVLTFSELFGGNTMEKLGKMKLILIHIFNAVLMIIAAAVDSYYVHVNTSGYYYYTRLIVVTVFSWILVASYIVQIIYVILQ
uniref:Cytochrome b561 domain-containing protein n=1 Tax=Panagrellus redivivus TaxID=6233 RepID=A0A7E4ZU74_PANRE